MWICISNTSKRDELEIGKSYEIFEHEHPKCVWVKIPNTTNGYKTIQAYLADFHSLSDWRNSRIDSILNEKNQS